MPCSFRDAEASNGIWALIKEGESLASGCQKDLIPLQRMWMELMKQQEAEEQQEAMEDDGERNLNPNRHPGGGGRGVNGGQMSHYVNDSIDYDENPNAHLLDDED